MGHVACAESLPAYAVRAEIIKRPVAAAGGVELHDADFMMIDEVVRARLEMMRQNRPARYRYGAQAPGIGKIRLRCLG